jgi:protein O-GlcNAc transferase
LRRGAYAEALAAFDRHLDAHPRDPAGRLGKSRALLSLGRYEEALAAANRALDQTSRFADAQEARGLALLGLGRDGEALACFDAALRLAGESAGLWCGIAEAPPASRQQRPPV